MVPKWGTSVLLVGVLLHLGAMLERGSHHLTHTISKDDISTERSMIASTTGTTRSSSTASSSTSTTTTTVVCEPGIVYREAGFPAIRRRREFGWLLEHKGFQTGAEVGVQKGENAKMILSKWKSCTEMHLIDLWAQQENYKDFANVDDENQQSNFEMTQQNVQPWKNITKFYRMLSTEAAPKIADQSLDFVYVDARHDYCGVLEDIRAYWPKLRPGGILAGHDYMTAIEVKKETPKQDWSLCMDGTVHQGAVRGAVEDFAKEQGLVISVTYREKFFSNWLVQKPTKPECV